MNPADHAQKMSCRCFHFFSGHSSFFISFQDLTNHRRSARHDDIISRSHGVCSVYPNITTAPSNPHSSRRIRVHRSLLPPAKTPFILLKDVIMQAICASLTSISKGFRYSSLAERSVSIESTASTFSLHFRAGMSPAHLPRSVSGTR